MTWERRTRVHNDATLRVRELTQNIYDIGDEIAEYIDHICQSMRDWDRELVADCLEELHDIVAEGRAEVRPDLSELNGLRQAFVSGVRAGSMSNEWGGGSWRDMDHPGRTLSFIAKPAGRAAHRGDASATHTPQLRGVRGLAYGDTDSAEGAGATGMGAGLNAGLSTGLNTAQPTGPTDDQAPADGPDSGDFAVASTASWRLWLREKSDELIGELEQLQTWVVQQTQLALESQSVLLPQCYMRAEQHCIELHQRWIAVVDRQPALATSMRGENPPAFLSERARVDSVVARIQRRRRGTAV